ncbi:MAG: DUF4476 domain-containing protein, partial [Chitinophagaceae bacterium]
VIDNAFSVDNNYFTTSQVVQMLRLVNSESYRLQLSKSSYPRITDRNNFGQLNNLLNSQASRNELQDYVDNYDDVYDEENYTNVAMSDANFNALLKSTQQQWQANAKLNSLTDVFNSSNNYFTAYQARQLIMLVDAEDSRLGLAKISYRTIVDPTNFNQVANLLTSQASKDQLTVFINNYNNSGTTTIAMLESDFNTLYKTIEGQYFPNQQMSSLTTTFNNTSYYFTTAQARQLIQLVSYESNRLQLAKLSYRTITDRNNFSQLYDILSSQASRNELDSYVKAYTN